MGDIMFERCTRYGCENPFLPVSGHRFSASERACMSCWMKFEKWSKEHRRSIRVATPAETFALKNAGQRVRLLNGNAPDPFLLNGESYYVAPRPFANPKATGKIAAFSLRDPDSVIVELDDPQDKVLSSSTQRFFQSLKYVVPYMSSGWRVRIENLELIEINKNKPEQDDDDELQLMYGG